MKKPYDFDENEDKLNNYYVNESIGMASGLLIAVIHNAGLATLTHNPSPMNLLTDPLSLVNKSPYLLISLGFSEKNAFAPDLKRKDLSEVIVYYEQVLKNVFLITLVKRILLD